MLKSDEYWPTYNVYRLYRASRIFCLPLSATVSPLASVRCTFRLREVTSSQHMNPFLYEVIEENVLIQLFFERVPHKISLNSMHRCETFIQKTAFGIIYKEFGLMDSYRIEMTSLR